LNVDGCGRILSESYTEHPLVEELQACDKIRSGYRIISFCAGDDKFNMAYMRHTGQWWEIFQKLTLGRCIEEIIKRPNRINLQPGMDIHVKTSAAGFQPEK
jgi:hypothetical protein